MPAIIFSIVLFPAPFLPTSAIRSLGLMTKLASENRGVAENSTPSLSIEIMNILSFVLCESTKLNDILFASMKTSQASCAVLVFPHHISLFIHRDILQWTSSHALLAVRTCFCGKEIFVCQQIFVEERTQYMCLDPWHATSAHISLLFSSFDGLCDFGQSAQGLFCFSVCYLIFVHVKSWQTDIGVGHMYGEDRIQFSFQHIVQYFVGIAYVISTGHHGINIIGSLDVLYMLFQICFHHFGQSPSIYRKNHAKHVFLVCYQSFQLISHPLAVASS